MAHGTCVLYCIARYIHHVIRLGLFITGTGLNMKSAARTKAQNARSKRGLELTDVLSIEICYCCSLRLADSLGRGGFADSAFHHV
jgi:hypothetical protein